DARRANATSEVHTQCGVEFVICAFSSSKTPMCLRRSVVRQVTTFPRGRTRIEYIVVFLFVVDGAFSSSWGASMSTKVDCAANIHLPFNLRSRSYMHALFFFSTKWVFFCRRVSPVLVFTSVAWHLFCPP
ncbi:unnamed protein product, partial [Ectocarpus sp. 12 AP-2014]